MARNLSNPASTSSSRKNVSEPPSSLLIPGHPRNAEFGGVIASGTGACTR